MSTRIGSTGSGIGLGVLNGTAKSVLYVDSSGKIAQENTSFYYDASVNTLTVSGTDATAPSFAVGTGIGLYNVGSGMLGFATNSTFKMGIDSSGRLGIGTTLPTHSVTFASSVSSTPFGMYFTSDQTTNYERAYMKWIANEFYIGTEKGGSGSSRAVRIDSFSNSLGTMLVGFGGATVYWLTGGFSRLSIVAAAITNIYPIVPDATHTAVGTTGNQTINKPGGSVNFAAGATALTVTNNQVTTNSIVVCQTMTNDTTAIIKNVVPASGSFTINLVAAATAETRVGFNVH